MESNFLKWDYLPILIYRYGFMIGTVYGSLENPKLTFSNNVKLRAGINKISLLSTAVGLPVSSVLAFLTRFYGLWMLIRVKKVILISYWIDFRMLVCILRHGTRGFLGRSHWRVSMRGQETWQRKSGLTRFGFMIFSVAKHTRSPYKSSKGNKHLFKECTIISSLLTSALQALINKIHNT